jgi:hypothetical protein
MLISRRNDTLVLIEQNEHGRAAGDLAGHWGNDTFAAPERPASARVAAAMHDDGWREADDTPLMNEAEGRPLHFLEIDMAEHVPLYGRGVDRVFEVDPYAGLLVSMHWTGLYRSRWGMQSGSVGFGGGASTLERLQTEAVDAEEQRWIEVKRGLMRDARRSDLEAGLWHSYDLLQAWDLLSLYVSLMDIRPSDGPVVPLASTLKGLDQVPGAKLIESVPLRIAGARSDLVLTPVADGVVTVDPYPFDVDSIDVSVTGKAIPDRRYASQEDARETLGNADEVTLTCQMKRA